VEGNGEVDKKIIKSQQLKVWSFESVVYGHVDEPNFLANQHCLALLIPKEFPGRPLK
jgi:hypothetical protein